MAPGLVQPGATYQHYKGNLYKVFGIGKMEDTHEDVVVYHGLEHGSPIWVRLITEFCAEVEWEGRHQPRFKYIEG